MCRHLSGIFYAYFSFSHSERISEFSLLVQYFLLPAVNIHLIIVSFKSKLHNSPTPVFSVSWLSTLQKMPDVLLLSLKYFLNVSAFFFFFPAIENLKIYYPPVIAFFFRSVILKREIPHTLHSRTRSLSLGLSLTPTPTYMAQVAIKGKLQVFIS